MGKLTVPGVRSRKASRGGGAPLVMVTAYDAGARTADAGVDLLLVGDSVAMVVLGHEDTMSVTVEELAHHTRCPAGIAGGAGGGRPPVAQLPRVS